MKAASIESRSLLAGRRCFFLAMIAFLIVAISGPVLAQQTQLATNRKVLQKVEPHYPEMAKGLRLSGTVRVAVEVAQNGRVISAAVLGGHPVFTQVAVDAARHFRFETGPKQTEEVVTFNFQP
jgi:protein TonB